MMRLSRSPRNQQLQRQLEETTFQDNFGAGDAVWLYSPVNPAHTDAGVTAPVHSRDGFTRNWFSTAALSTALGALCATTGFAQSPGSAPSTASVVVANPT